MSKNCKFFLSAGGPLHGGPRGYSPHSPPLNPALVATKYLHKRKVWKTCTNRSTRVHLMNQKNLERVEVNISATLTPTLTPNYFLRTTPLPTPTP